MHHTTIQACFQGVAAGDRQKVVVRGRLGKGHGSCPCGKVLVEGAESVVHHATLLIWLVYIYVCVCV